jgi:hypothetical protein
VTFHDDDSSDSGLTGRLIRHDLPIVRGLRREVTGSTLDGMRTAASLNSDLDFYVAVTVHERDGRYKATADLVEDSRSWGPGIRHRRR